MPAKAKNDSRPPEGLPYPWMGGIPPQCCGTFSVKKNQGLLREFTSQNY